MLIDQKTAGGKALNAEDFNFPTGVYTCTLKDVSEIAARDDDPKGTPRLVFEFEVMNGPYRGKKTCTFVRKNLFAGGGSRNAKPSNLFKLAKSLGCADPMAGFDTNIFVGKFYTIVVKNESDRGWPESIIPASGLPAAGTPAPPRQGPPSRAQPVNQTYWIDTGDGKETQGTSEEVRARIFAGGLKAGQLMICPEGGNEWKPASAFGFEDSPIPA